MHALFLAAVLTAARAQAPVVPQVPSARMQPGYGVVQAVTPVRVGVASAAAGGSAPALPAYRLTVRMADGSLQYRDVDRLEVRPGEPVLLTNAGDVVPDDVGGRDLEGTLREQCLAQQALKRKSAAPRAPSSAGTAPSRE